MTEVPSIFSFEHVVYDLDGTLIDSVNACITAFAATLAPYGIPHDEAESFYRDTTGQTLREQYPKILQSRDVLLSEASFHKLEDAFNAAFGGTAVQFFPNARALVRLLKSLGKKQFVSSASSDRIVHDRLEKGGVSSCFALKFGSTAMPKGQKHVERILRHVGGTRTRFESTTAFCGDSETDMRIATEAGLYAIGVLGTVSEERLRAAGAKRVVTSVAAMLRDLQ